MTGAQYKKAIAALGLTQTQAGDIFGVTFKTSSRWANNRAPVPWSTAMLLELMVHKRLELEFRFDDRAERMVWTFQADQTITNGKTTRG